MLGSEMLDIASTSAFAQRFMRVWTVCHLPKRLGRARHLTAVLCDIQNRVGHGQIFVRNIAALARQILLDATELFGIDCHADVISVSVNRP
jgi:hypothetical protein